jgi:hypothetical protein
VLLPALVYPAFLGITLALLAAGELTLPQPDTEGAWLWWLGAASLALGAAAPMLTAAAAAVRRGRPGLAPRVLLMPVYWLWVSRAGYQALCELIRRPFHWEKTAHGGVPSPSRYRWRRARTAAASVPSSR